MFTKFSLWKMLMVRWIRSSRECRKLRRQRDVLFNNYCMCVPYDSFERVPDELTQVFNEINNEE